MLTLAWPLAAQACATVPDATPASPTILPAQGDSDARPGLSPALAEDEDYVVRLVVDSVVCSGTLIDEDRVLTAHHCVGERDGDNGFTGRAVSPDRILVELGGDVIPWGEVGVRAIVAPPCGLAAGVGDIAILVLERRLVGIPTLTPSLDYAVSEGEHIEPVGFGHCTASSASIERKTRVGGRIDALRPSRFRLNAGICPGDSGGPALTSGGRLVGVVSAAVMDGSESTVGRSEFTRLDAWRAVFSNAQLIAEGATQSELPPVGGCEE